MSHPRIETMPQWPFGERQNKAILNHTEIQKLVEGPTIQSQHEMNKSENVFSKTSNFIYTLYVYCISSLQLLPTTHCLNHVICNMSLYTQYVYSSGHNQSIYQILLVSSRFNKEVVRFQRVATRCQTCLVFRASSISFQRSLFCAKKKCMKYQTRWLFYSATVNFVNHVLLLNL